MDSGDLSECNSGRKIILRRQPARQRPVGRAQRGVPPETARPALSLGAGFAPGSASSQTPRGSPGEGPGASARGKGGAEEGPLKCGVLELLPPPKARGSSALGKGAPSSGIQWSL